MLAPDGPALAPLDGPCVFLPGRSPLFRPGLPETNWPSTGAWTAVPVALGALVPAPRLDPGAGASDLVGPGPLLLEASFLLTPGACGDNPWLPLGLS